MRTRMFQRRLANTAIHAAACIAFALLAQAVSLAQTGTQPSIAISSVSPGSATLVQGGSSQVVTVNLTRTNYTGGINITLAADSLPTGVTAGYLQPGTGNSDNITLSAATTAALVSGQTITITASGNGVSSATGSFSVTVVPATMISLTLSSTSVLGGTASTGTVTLNGVAPAEGVVVALSSSNTAAATVPASVTVGAGWTTKVFGVTTFGVPVAQSVTITASSGGVEQQATLTVNPATLSSLTLNPTSVIGGTSSTATITLTGVAPIGGTVVTLSSSNTAAVAVPASVTVSGDLKTRVFAVTTFLAAANQSVTITASYGGVNQQATLTVNATSLSSLALSPTIVLGGTASTGTVALTEAAPVAGVVVTLSSSNTAAATVPASVTVGAGATTKTFTVSTLSVAATQSVTITASYEGVNQGAGLTVSTPTLSSVTLSPTSVNGGTSSTGTVTLTGVAPAAGVVVALSSSDTAAATAPASVTVSGGWKTKVFGVTTSAVAATQSATITASSGGINQQATLTVNAPTLSSFTLSPTSVNGGTSSTGEVILTGVAPAGGAVVTLASSNTAAATVPASVTVSGDFKTRIFAVTSLAVATAQSATITASYGGVNQEATLTVEPPGSIAITHTPNSLNFGDQPFLVTSSPQTITLTSTGSATLDITSINVTGANAGDFTQSNNCSSPVNVAGNCTVSVTFSPRSTQAETGAVTIADNAGNGLLAVSLTGTGINSTGQFMTLSPDKTYLVNTFTNNPVFMTGEDAWDLTVQVSNADAATYLADRAARGYSVIWVAAADNANQSNPPQDFYGNVPFDGADFTNEDATYWAHIDSVIQLAASYGITVALSPAFVGLTNAEGYRASYLNSSDSTLTAYGVWLGNRYQSYPNIIWVIGGDADPTDTALYAKLSDLATGIQSVDAVHLLTAEAARFYETGGAAPNGGWSSVDAWPGPPSWLNPNWVYNGYSTVQAGCARNYALSPFMASMMGEDWYEGEHLMTELQLKEEAYWAVLSGCTLGRIFGNNAIWSMGGPSETMGQTWQSQLGSAGSVSQSWLGKLMRSREFWKMIPDTNNTVMTAGYGSGLTLSVDAITSDGQTIIAYIPNGNGTTVTVDMTQITSAISTANCWWFNPTDGSTTLIGSYANSGTQDFTPPDSNDWVLVIDAADANLPAPGSAAWEQKTHPRVTIRPRESHPD